MFKILNKKHEQVMLLENPKSPLLKETIATIGELTFSLPTSQSDKLELEGYVQVEGGEEYVIKEKVKHGSNTELVCMLNIEELVGKAFATFTSKENTVLETAELIVFNTDWIVINNSSVHTKIRNMYGKVTNAYNLLQLMCTVYGVEVYFDTHKKIVRILDKVGSDNGTYFMNDLNLKRVTHDTHSHKLITRCIPVGKDGLTIESVNGGKNYIENHTYSNKIITGIWQSDRHDNPQDLKDDAEGFLSEMAIPYETYEVQIEDLYKLREKEIFKFDIGDVVTIIDEETNTHIQQRIIQREYNLLDPTKDVVKIANKEMTFTDYYKQLQVIADMTESVIGSDGTISGGSIGEGSLGEDKFPTTVPNKPTVYLKVLGFASIEISWTYEGKAYYQYEVYASQQKGFTPSTMNKVHEGQSSSFLHQAEPMQTWYVKVCGINSHGTRSAFSDEVSITTRKVDVMSNYFSEAAIGEAVVGSLTTEYMTAGIIKGHWIDARQLSVTDGNGKRTLDIDSFGNVNLDVAMLKVKAEDVATSSQLTQKADSIVASFTNSTSSNLLKNTEFTNNLTDWEQHNFPNKIETFGKYKGFDGGATVFCQGVGQGLLQKITGLQVGQKYTFSCFIETPSSFPADGGIKVWNGKYFETGTYLSENGNYQDWYTRLSITFECQGDEVIVYTENKYNTQGRYYVTGAMLNIGEVASPYVPNTKELYGHTIKMSGDGLKVSHDDGSYADLNSKELGFYGNDKLKRMGLKNGYWHLYKWDQDAYMGFIGATRVNMDGYKYGTSFMGGYHSWYHDFAIDRNAHNDMGSMMGESLMRIIYDDLDSNVGNRKGTHIYSAPLYVHNNLNLDSNVYANNRNFYDINLLHFDPNHFMQKDNDGWMCVGGYNGVTLGYAQGDTVRPCMKVGGAIESWANWDFKGYELKNVKLVPLMELQEENEMLKLEKEMLKQQQFEQDEIIIENAFEIANIQLGGLF